MKESQLANVYGASLQKVLDQDMADLATEMSTGTAYRSGRKIVPNYEEVDVFRRLEYDHERRMSRQWGKNDITQNLIQPNEPGKPRVMVVLPNE